MLIYCWKFIIKSRFSSLTTNPNLRHTAKHNHLFSHLSITDTKSKILDVSHTRPGLPFGVQKRHKFSGGEASSSSSDRHSRLEKPKTCSVSPQSASETWAEAHSWTSHFPPSSHVCDVCVHKENCVMLFFVCWKIKIFNFTFLVKWFSQSSLDYTRLSSLVQALCCCSLDPFELRRINIGFSDEVVPAWLPSIKLCS